MEIKYTNISNLKYFALSRKERASKPYCIEYSDGYKCWCVNLLLHREDGPAIESTLKYINNINSGSIWWLDGKEYTFEHWCEILNISNEEIIFLRLKYL